MHSAASSSPFADFGLALLVFIVPDGDDRILLLLGYVDVTWVRNALSELRSPAFAAAGCSVHKCQACALGRS